MSGFHDMSPSTDSAGFKHSTLVEEGSNISEELTVKQIKDRWSRIRVIPEDRWSRIRVIPEDRWSRIRVIPVDRWSRIRVIPEDRWSRNRVIPEDSERRFL
jgi:hypothetical protein